ncbi:PadR family transcriptional regulator [Pyrodictium abyssi]|uniref:PadR family transcriptional regulator n=1 Tax=Pyrodictium abyssi TaxID=54256 RepID=UPI0030C6D412
MGPVPGVDRAVEKLLRDLRVGLYSIVVLDLLARRGPLHGYAVRRYLEEAAPGLAPSESTVYDVLKRLEKLGLLESYWARSPAGTMRKYYRARPGAEEALRRLVKELRALIGGVVCSAEEGRGSETLPSPRD